MRNPTLQYVKLDFFVKNNVKLSLHFVKGSIQWW